MSGKNIKNERSDYITLDEKQLKIFNILKSKSGNPPDQWPSIKDITEEMHIRNADAQKILESLGKKPGMILIKEKVGHDNTLRYGLAPTMLEKLVIGEEHTNHKKNVYNSLYIAEPAFGTKAFDHEYTMKGLALFLKANNYAQDIQQVIIQGGIIPHVPPFSSKAYDNDLKFLGQVKRTDKTKSFSEEWLEKKIDNEYEQEFYNEHINNKDKKKIMFLSDAFDVAEIEIKKLMDGLPEDTALLMGAGEEDRKNIGHIEKAYIQQWSKEKEKQIKAMKEEARNRILQLAYNNFKNQTKKTLLERIIHNTSLIRNQDEDKNDYFVRIEEKIKDAAEKVLEKFGSELPEYEYKILEERYYKKDSEINSQISKFLADNIRVNNHPKDTANEKIKKIDKITAKNTKLMTTYQAKLEFLADSAKWTDQLLGEGLRAAVTWFTGQYPVFSAEVELIFKKSKDQYTKHFFKWDIKQPKTFHVTPRKTIEVETGVILNVLTGEKDVAKIEYDNTLSGKKKILMIHNLNSSFSDNTGVNALKDAKLESNYQNEVITKFYGTLDKNKHPDIMLLGGHGIGGFRVMPWFKETEDFIKDDFVKGQEIGYLITLPTLQSVEKLKWLDGRIVNNHVKRFKKGPYASGVVLHSEDADGVNRFKIIDTAKLIEFGKLASEIDVYNKYLNDKKVPKNVKNKLHEIVAETIKKIELAGDFHLGAPDHPDRYSKDQFIRAMQHYQKVHGLPDIASWDEILHGVEERIFNSGSRYLGKIPEKFRQSVIEPILNDDSMSVEERLIKIGQESLRNQRAITVHNSSDQKYDFKLKLKPYGDQILAKPGGKLALVSGNHYNKSQKHSDEALELSLQFLESYIDNNKLHIFDGKGNDVGLGTIMLEGNKKLFVMHKFPEKSDEIYGIMSHMRKMNNDADIVSAGDRHQTGAGYADGHFIVLHPGMEPINKYVPLIGKPAGLRGFNNVYYDTRHRGIYTVEFVLNPTLEKIIEKEKIL